ncbi:Stathmin-1-A [Portunus trituberculatus]|uniref:Stathmin-1-A n=1 Tax=Portunus trituberculatus TaxID=210409 RepID=A0A5B7FDI5_PORTR|nr:Stathmin-1-A [Portunus trituberculatus]
MCYEVILAEPSADKPTPPSTSPRPKSMTAEEIEQKLLQAEERRKEDYAQKVRLGHEEAIRQLEERIQAKIAVATNKRESEILKKLETLREHDRRAEMVRANKERIMAAEKQDAASSG